MMVNSPTLTYLLAKELNKDVQRKVEHTHFTWDLHRTIKAPSWRYLLGSLRRDTLGMILPKIDTKVALGGVNIV